MIPLSEVLSRVRTRFETASGGSSSRFSDSRITDFAIEAMETLAENTGFYERSVVIPIAPNRTWYDLRGFTPETVVKIKSIFNSVRNTWIDPANQAHLPLRWEDSTGAPQVFFTRGIFWFGLWPRAQSSTDTNGYLKVYFSGIPPRYRHGQAVLRDLPDDFVPALEDYVLYEMSGIDGETKAAVTLWQSYLSRERELRQFTDQRAEGARRARLGGVITWQGEF